jgi:hypothetical protein
MKTNIHFWSRLAKLFLKWEMLQTKIVKKIKTHIFCSIKFVENHVVYEMMCEKFWKAGQATDDSTAHAHFALDT